MRLRDATQADLPAVLALETALFGADAWSGDVMREELTGPHRKYIVLCDSDGNVHGYAGLLIVGSDGDIQTIAVAPESRGAGHGRLLMRELLAEAARRGASQVFLEVRADNPVARSLYETLGFAEIAVRTGYYQPDGVDAIVMRLSMKEQQ